MLPEERNNTARLTEDVVELQTRIAVDRAVGRGRAEGGETEVTGHQLQAEEVKPVAHDEDALDTPFLQKAAGALHALPGRVALVLQENDAFGHAAIDEVVPARLRLGEAVTLLAPAGDHDQRRHACPVRGQRLI